jgi:hypothetical protein
MNKKTLSISIIFLSFFFVFINAQPLHAQQTFYFGVQGGAAFNLPDANLQAIDTFQYKYGVYNHIENNPYGSSYSESFTPISDMMGDGFVNINLSPAIAASLYFGYEGNKHFGIRIGADIYYNVNDIFKFNILAISPQSVEYPPYIIIGGTINYTYSFVNIPLLATIHFANKKSFRMGVALGPFLYVPIGDIQATYQLTSMVELPSPLPLPVSNTIKQDLGAGFQLELLTEFKIGKAAITFNIGYSREFFKFFSSMVMNTELMTSDKITIPRYDRDTPAERFSEVEELKLTVFQGIKATLGIKFNVQISGPPGASGPVSDIDSNYFMIIGSQVEGPLKIMEIQKLCNAGVIKADSLIWKTGMDDWKSAETFEEITAHLK